MPSRGEPCAFCERTTTTRFPFDNDIVSCYTCSKAASITFSDAKRIYRLRDDNLERLQAWQFSTRYHARVRRLLKTHVEQLAEEIHGTGDPEAIASMRRTAASAFEPDMEDAFVELWKRLRHDSPKGAKAGHKRYKQVMREFPDMHQISALRTTFERYVNGDLKTLAALRREHALFVALQAAHETFPTANLGNAVNSALHRYRSNPDVPASDVVDAILRRKERKQRLCEALAARGLVLRQDSALCSNYVDLENYTEYSMDEIVEIMDNMQFLHTHTNYAQINRTMLNRAFERKRSHYYEYRDFGWQDDSSGDDDDYWVDKRDVSRNAQAKAMQQYKGPREIVPHGLKHLLPPLQNV